MLKNVYLAMSTPRCKEFDKPHVFRLKDQLFEIAFCQLNDLIAASAGSTTISTTAGFTTQAVLDVKLFFNVIGVLRHWR
jgi:hypothetical protein